MKETTPKNPSSAPRLGVLGGWLLMGVGHCAATMIVAAMISVIILPLGYIEPIARRVLGVDEIWAMSTTSLVIHVLLSACIWAFVVIIYQLIRLHRAERKTRSLRLARGTVITETLIVMPVFFLLSFGMAQLAISNIAAILANVAAYQAARAAWIWQPEEDASEKRMGIEDGIAVEKCRIAVALVMLPVANGEFLNDPSLPTYASKMRVAAVGAHIPFGGTLTGLDPEVSDLLAGAASVRFRLAVRDNQSVTRALDESSFILRTASKFTHAFQASSCTINGDHSVTMVYKLHVVMPLMGPLFGNSGFDVVEGRAGYFQDFTRELGLTKQVILPNAKQPVNKLIDFPTPDEPNATDLINGAMP